MNIANLGLQAKLYQRMSVEQMRYWNWLLDQSPADILNHAAEYTVQEDIVMELPNVRVKVL